MHTVTRNLREWLLPNQLTFFHRLWRRTFLNAIMGGGPAHLKWFDYKDLTFYFKNKKTREWYSTGFLVNRNCRSLQQLVCCLCERTTNGLLHLDVGEVFLSTEAVNQVRKSIGLFSEILNIYLIDISGEHNLRTFAGTRNDSLYFVRS